MKRIGVWNTAFLGDAVLTLPLLQSLRGHYPDAHIDFYVRGGIASLFSSHPAIDKVIAYDKRGQHGGFGAALSLAKHLAAQKYDLWISPHTSLRSSFFAKCTKAPIRIGYTEASMASFAYTHKVLRDFGKKPEIERLLELLRPLNIPILRVWPEIILPVDECLAAEKYFARFNEPVLGIHPGSTWATKCWPAEYFAELGARAVQSGSRVILFAGRGEERVAKQVLDLLEQKLGKDKFDAFVDDKSSVLSLTELAAFIKQLNCYATNDSGPMHIAWAARVPIVAMFGPTVTSFGFAPRGLTSKIHEVELSCRPCSLHGPQVCPLGHHNCMKMITPEQVWADVQKFLPHSQAGISE